MRSPRPGTIGAAALIRAAAVSLCCLAMGCGTPMPAAPAPESEPSTTRPAPPAAASREILVEAFEDGGDPGIRAVYTVRAGLSTARDVLLDFDRQASYRPAILESRVLSRDESGGTVEFRFPGLLGMDPAVTCRIDVEESATRVLIRFHRLSGSPMVTRLNGRFELTAGEVPGTTRVLQEYVVSAIRMDRDGMRRNHETDARAVRAEIERVASGAPPTSQMKQGGK